MGGTRTLAGKKHLFFDLDHTLWDFESNSRETLSELWSDYNLSSYGVQLPKFLTHFELVNTRLWGQCNIGEIDKHTIRHQRFRLIFQDLIDMEVDEVQSIQEDYLKICPTKPHVMDGAIEVLEELKPHFDLHLITNGFDEVQATKLSGSGLDTFFPIVVTSGRAGYLKPKPEIFQFALDEAKAEVHESVMIGDNPESDIEGAFNFGMDQIFFNPNSLECPISPSVEIKSLREIPAILL